MSWRFWLSWWLCTRDTEGRVRLTTLVSRLHLADNTDGSQESVAGTTLSSRDSWRRLEGRLEAHLGNAEAERHPPAVLVIDLDRFRAVNDCLGHSLGGELLESVANRLGDAVGDQGALAHLGGDEFAVMIDRCSGTGHARSVARAIRARWTRGVCEREHRDRNQ